MSSSVSTHLGIPLHEYDDRIRTFVPYYEELLDTVAALVAVSSRRSGTIVDLGTGTGALAERCLRASGGARLIGIDADPGMLAHARSRLSAFERVELVAGSFLEVEIPPCDTIVASLALHHVASGPAKAALYRACRSALARGGTMLLADCYLPQRAALVADGFRRWRAHLERTYARDEAAGFLRAWSGEDTYFPLAEELRWLHEAGFQPDVVWRRDLFAVIACE